MLLFEWIFHPWGALKPHPHTELITRLDVPRDKLGGYVKEQLKIIDMQHGQALSETPQTPRTPSWTIKFRAPPQNDNNFSQRIRELSATRRHLAIFAAYDCSWCCPCKLLFPMAMANIAAALNRSANCLFN